MEKIVSYAKKVTMLELFYDLVYVLAVAKATAIIHHLHNGVVGVESYVKFIIVCAILMLMWFGETVYINKYGEDTRGDRIGLLLHMLGVIYITNNITTEWRETFVPFNVTAIAMTIVVMLQYGTKAKKFKEVSMIVKDIKVQMAILVLEVGGLSIALGVGYNIGAWITSIAYLSAMVLPAVIKSRESMHENPINFPHLVERVSLITIIIFGEMIVTVAGTFKNDRFGLTEMVIFATVGSLFYTYWLVIEEIVDERQKTRGFLLRYSHIGMFVGLSTITVCFSFPIEQVDLRFLVHFRLLGLGIFYISLMGIASYNKDKYKMHIGIGLGYFMLLGVLVVITLMMRTDSRLVLNSLMFLNVASMTVYVEAFKLICDKKALKNDNSQL